jgi:hypothetical protein
MGLALGALAGILGGLGGLPKGMAEGTAADQRQQALDEQVRHRQMIEQQSQTDLGQLSQMLGIQLPGVQPGTRVPTSTANLVAGKGMADQAKQQEQARMDALRMQLPESVRPYFGIPGGAELYKAQQPGKPSPPHYIEGPGGEISAVTMQNGAPSVTEVPGVKGKGMASRALVTRQDIEAQLRNEGLTPGTPKWENQYLRYAQPGVVVPEVGFFAKPDVVGTGQPPQAATNPNVPPAQQPAVQEAGARLRAAVDAANALPGVPPPGGAGGSPPQGAPAPRTAGAPGGPQPALAFPEKPLSPADAGSLGVPYGTTKKGAYGATPLSTAQRTKVDAQASVLAMIDNMEGDLKGISQPKTPMDRLVGIPKAVLGVKGQTDPKLAAFHSRIESTLALIVRALGEVGTLTDGDIQRARNLQPTVYPIPDTEAVVREKLDGLRKLVQEVAARTGSRPENMSQPAAPAPAAPQGQYIEGKAYKGSDGKLYRFQGGQMVPQ